LWCNYISKPYIITTRGSDILKVIPDLLLHKGIKAFYFKKLYSLFKKSFINAKYITCTSQQQQKKLKELFLIDSNLIRTGVDVEKIKGLNQPELINKKLENKKFVFSPRFMMDVYNIEYQLSALELLPKDIIKEYVFVFIKGRNFNEDYFIKQQAKLKMLEQNIGLRYLIFNYLEQKELWMYYKKASLTIMTPTSDGTPNSALEAMAAGCPLIISDLPYDNVLFDDTCIKTPLNDSKELSLLIEQNLRLKNQIIIGKASKRVSEFGNRDTEMKKLSSLYSNLLK
jgi:glycosyltransferase involved in cell wall biosynthesis